MRRGEWHFIEARSVSPARPLGIRDRLRKAEVRLIFGRGPGRGQGRQVRGQAKVYENFLDDLGIFDDLDDLHRTLAARAGGRIPEHPLEQVEPAVPVSGRGLFRPSNGGRGRHTLMRHQGLKIGAVLCIGGKDAMVASTETEGALLDICNGQLRCT